MKEYMRLESDSIGTMEVPEDAYYGVQALRAKENFPITGTRLHPVFIKNLAKIKRAAAITNRKAGRLKPEIANAIESACNEVVCGMFDKEFIVDGIQGGAGTSANMNMNEVIANRAIEMLCGKKETTPLFIQTTTSIWHSPQTMSFQPPEINGSRSSQTFRQKPFPFNRCII